MASTRSATCATGVALSTAAGAPRRRGRLPPRRAAAGAPLLRRAGRHLRHQRHGHGQRARGRARPSVRAVVVVTSDKCYENRESHRGYRERRPAGRPRPLFAPARPAPSWSPRPTAARFSRRTGLPRRVATARAGNVIGGGDWADDRLVPDIVRGRGAKRRGPLRHPRATRPWQHVLDPLHGYLLLVEKRLGGADARRLLLDQIARYRGPPGRDLIDGRARLPQLRRRPRAQSRRPRQFARSPMRFSRPATWAGPSRCIRCTCAFAAAACWRSCRSWKRPRTSFLTTSTSPRTRNPGSITPSDTPAKRSQGIGSGHPAWSWKWAATTATCCSSSPGRAFPVLGVEPAANVARVAEEKGVRTRVAFFG